MSGVENTGGPPAGINRVEGGAYSQASGTGGNEAQHDLTTTVGRVAENEARAARNVLRVFRREAGEEGVDADEVLLELEGADPSGGENEFLEPITQTSATMSSQSEPLAGVAGTAQAGNITHFEAFMLAMRQEGDLKDKALAYLQSLAPGAKKDAEEKDTGVLKESAAMAAEQRAARRNRIDRRLINLVKLGFHLPLTLCTNEALEIVRQSPARLTCKNQTDFSGAKVSVVDVTVGWPEESSLTSEEWRDAWTNYLTILPEVLEPEGVERFKRHHNFLVRQQNFSTRFPAILRFDIGIRHDYFWGKECVPFFPASHEYVAELAQIQSDISMEHLVGTNSGSGGSNSGRFQPYPSQSDRGGFREQAWRRRGLQHGRWRRRGEQRRRRLPKRRPTIISERQVAHVWRAPLPYLRPERTSRGRVHAKQTSKQLARVLVQSPLLLVKGHP